MMNTNSDIKSGIIPSPSSTEPEVSVKECEHKKGDWYSYRKLDGLIGTTYVLHTHCPKCRARLLPDGLKSPSPDAVEVPLASEQGQDSTQADKTSTIQ